MPKQIKAAKINQVPPFLIQKLYRIEALHENHRKQNIKIN